MELNPEIDRLFDKGGKVDSLALADFLEPIAKGNPEAFIAFTVRNALRLLPLAANGSSLGEKHLFAIWHALWLATKGMHNGMFKQDLLRGDFTYAAAAARAARAAARSAAADSSSAAARSAARSARAAADSAADSAAVARSSSIVARAAADSAAAAARAAPYYTGREFIYQDLHQLQQQKKLIARPLFPTETPKKFSRTLPAIKKRLNAIDVRIGNDLQAMIDGDGLENEPWDKYLPLAKKFGQLDDSEIGSPALDEKKPEVKIHNTPYENLNNPAASQSDSLDRQPLADALARWLGNPDNKNHWTIGLFGDWGVGKTSFINFLKTELSIDETKANGKFIYSEFNAWKYEDSGSIHAGIAKQMQSGLKLKLRPWRKVELVLRFVWRRKKSSLFYGVLLALLALVLANPSIFSFLSESFQLKDIFGKQVFSFLDAWVGYGWLAAIPLFIFLGSNLIRALKTPLASKVKSIFALPNFSEQIGDIPVMHEQIKDLVEIRTSFFSLKKDQGQKKILFVIDDLDRCRPETVVKVFEAVRLVMDIDQVVVLIAIDQRIALASLALHYKDLSQHHTADPIGIARDYIGKVIQVPILLEDPTSKEVEGYLHSTIWGKDSSGYPEGQNTNGSEPLVTSDPAQEPEGQPKADPSSNNPVKNETETKGEIKNGDVVDEKSVEEGIEKATEKEIKGLSEEQKKQFIEWSTHFKIANPRHIKRLDNAYNLLRLRYPDEDEGEDHYPRLVLLMWLEYVNELPLKQREWLQQLSLKAQQQESLVLENWLSQPDSSEEYPIVIKNWERLLEYLGTNEPMTAEVYIRLYQQVKIFSLPAVEKAI